MNKFEYDKIVMDKIIDLMPRRESRIIQDPERPVCHCGGLIGVNRRCRQCGKLLSLEDLK